jgi:exodeoxyribonuclease VII small subunit
MSASTKSQPTEPQIGYQDALAELDEILDELEGEAVDVDRLGARVKRAAELIAICRGRIASARVEIESVVADLDRLDEISPNA